MNIDPEVYRNAKSTRPSWANALIVAACIFLGALLLTFLSGFSAAWWLFGAAFVTLIVAGILALTNIKR